MLKNLLLIAIAMPALVACLAQEPNDDANRRIQAKGFTYACGAYFLADPANKSVEVYNLAVKGWQPIRDGAYSIIQDPQNNGNTTALALWETAPNDTDGLVTPDYASRIACSFQVSDGNVISKDSDPTLNTMTDQFDDKTGISTLNPLPLGVYNNIMVCDRVIHDEICGTPNDSARSYEFILVINF